jgi:glycosyltransferase involved in cell wall biosynthesis
MAPFNSIAIPVLGFTASGGNRVLSKLADQWTEMGVKVDFIVENKSKPYFPTNARILRCSTGTFWTDLLSGPLRHFGILKSIFNLASTLRKSSNKYDLVIASHSFTAIACYLSGCSSKTVYYVQGYDPEVLQTKGSFSSWIASNLARLSYVLCRIQIVNSSHYLKYKLINSCHVVPPGLDLDIFSSKSCPGEFSGTVIKVGIIGRKELHKVRPVIESYLRLRACAKNTKLIIAFGNIESSYLNGIGEYEVVKPRNDEELASFYRYCDIFLALSDFDQGAFYPALEALATGTALVSNGFYKATSKNCWIVNKTDNIDDLLGNMISNSLLRKKKAEQGLNDIKELNWSSIANLFLDYSKQIVRS